MTTLAPEMKSNVIFNFISAPTPTAPSGRPPRAPSAR
jgi:hypothetical protein